MILQDYHGERGVKRGFKSDYVICERSLMVFLTGWKFMNQPLISPSRLKYLFANLDIALNTLMLILMLTLKILKWRDRNQLSKNFL